MNENDLVVVARFDEETQASLAIAALEDAGIRVFSADGNIISAHGLIAYAVGGVKVMVARADELRARTILGELEKEWQARKDAAKGKTVSMVCDECGKQISFPGRQAGTVQKCPECMAFVDVPELEGEGETGEEGEGSERAAGKEEDQGEGEEASAGESEDRTDQAR